MNIAFQAAVAAVAAVAICADAAEWNRFQIWGGGNIQSVEISPSSPRVWYSYVDVGGPYRSDDAGKNWRPLHDNFSSMQRRRGLTGVRGLSIDPRNPDSFVIASGHSWWRVGGICVSRDGGKTFRQTQEARFYGNDPRRRNGFILARNPFCPDELVAGSDATGIFRSIDNGENWIFSGFDGYYFSDVRYDRVIPGRIYASAPRWGVGLLEKGSIPGKDKERKSGLFRSDDGGKKWYKLQDDAPSEMVQLSNGELLGIFEEKAIFISRDSGKNWIPYGDGLPKGSIQGSLSPYRWLIAAAGPDFFIVGNSCGTLYRRKPRESAWTQIVRQQVSLRNPGQESHINPERDFGRSAQTLVIDPQDSNHWLLTDWFAIWETFDAGKNWQSAMRGISPLVSFFVAADPHNSDNLFYGLADMGLLSSIDGGKSWKKEPFVGINSIAFSHKTSGLLLICGGKNTIELRRRTPRGVRWEYPKKIGLPKLSGTHTAFTVAADPKEEKFYLCVAGPVGPGKGGVYVSSDAGDHWTWCGNGLKKGFSFDQNEFQNGGRQQIHRSSDGSAVVCSNKSKQLYYWDAVNKEWKYSRPLPGGTQPDEGLPLQCAVAADPFVPGRFLAGGEACLLESHDGGKHFDSNWLVSGTIYAISFDPFTPDYVAVSLPDRILLSRDGGKHFSVLQLDGIPCNRSNIFLFNKRVYVIGGSSGVFWRDVK